MSSRIDTLEPNGEPLAALLASIVARISSPDFIEPHASSTEADTGDIARHAERAIAGIPLGVARTGMRADLLASVRSLLAAGVGASTQFLQRVHRQIAAGLRVLLRIGANALHRLHVRLRVGAAPALRQRLAALAAPSGRKVGAGLALSALGLALVITFVSGRHGRLEQPSDDAASAQPPPASAALAEERPVRDSPDEFTRANLRYCTFQQIRLEALGPITEGADLVVFNALVDDWNARCMKYRYRVEDREAVNAEAGRRRALLEVEGRALMNVWRRKVVTTVQQRPTAAGLDAGDATATALPVPEQTNDAIDRLPLLITQGRATVDDPDRAFLLRSPSLALLRGEVALRVQRRLNDLGYTISPVDGTWGSASRAALRRFKKANGLLADDAFDAETVTRLFATSAVKAPANQHKDETATVETVYPPPPAADMNPLNRADGRRIQQRLADLGYYSGRGEGAWDADSRAALRRFKAASGLDNNEEWDAPAETVLFDDQAVRAGATPSPPHKTVTPPVTAAVPLPPKRPAPPAKAAEPAAAMAPRDVPRPPGLIPTPPRATGTAARP